MKKAKKIFSAVMSVLTVVIFIFGLLIFVSVLKASAGKIPNMCGYSVLQVQTGSMEPELMTGSIIIVHKTDVDSLEVGDIISFYAADSEISGLVNTHRIVNVSKNMSGQPVFVTKGDANDFNDPQTVSNINVIGKVCYDMGTVSGSVISILRNPKVIFFMIILPLLIITFMEAFNLVNMIVTNKMAKQEEIDDEKSQDEED